MHGRATNRPRMTSPGPDARAAARRRVAWRGHAVWVPLVATEGLTKRYPGVTALDDVSLALDGGIVGLVGANGAGKSTLLKVLLGLVPATSGKAWVLGLDADAQGSRIRQRVGYMPEHDCLPPDVGAADFVTHMARMSGLPADAARERAAETLRHVGLYEERYRAIGGYSTGMHQRVKLAQALVHDPSLVLLDEPTAGLDPAGREEMLGLIRRIGTEFGIAVIMASHLLGEVERICDHLVAIDGGRLIRSAPLAEFTALTRVLTVEVEEGSDRLADALARAGRPARREGRRVLVDLDGPPPYDLVRDLVAELGLPLARIEQGRHQLEDLFRPAEGDAPDVGTPEPEPADGHRAGNAT